MKNPAAKDYRRFSSTISIARASIELFQKTTCSRMFKDI